MTSGTGLLDRAVSYAVSAVGDVTPALLPRPTPCRGWNLEMLLSHACESLAALHSVYRFKTNRVVSDLAP
jgi:hypothetical protein